MRVSLNSVKRFTTVDLPVDELVNKINQQLGGVESVVDMATRYDGAVIVKIVSCKKHDNADKLNVCMVDDGSGELTQVVCGAPNVREGMFVVWLKPGSTVPSTAEDAEPFVLGARELRGVMSNGMLASPKELSLGDSHDGILEIDPSEWKPGGDIVPGASFAACYGLDDTIIDIENKMFTHRPDLFGQLGVARELAGIQHQPFVSPDWYATASGDPLAVAGDTLPLVVFNDAPEQVPRFMAVVVKGVTVRPSPVWLQAELVRLGGKPINNVVDVTNYIMLLTAQPTHAYDYAKVRGQRLGARMGVNGETVTLLNGKSYELTSDDIVIADAEGPVGLAGIMGGGDSDVSTETTDIVLEVANFDMYTVRKSSMRHGVFTDALTRFNKGQSPLQNAVVLRKLVACMTDVAGGSIASETYDVHQLPAAERKFSVSPSFVNRRLGLDLTRRDIEELLANVEFKIYDNPGDDVHYEVPFWRTDIELPEDIVEEVGRLYGFDRLPRELPRRSIKATAGTPALERKRMIRSRLAGAGANEVLTYSFVHEKLLAKAGQDAAQAYELSNALSPDLQYYRLGLTPSLLDKVHMNVKAGYADFALFELGKTHFKDDMSDEEPSVPSEDDHAALVITRKNLPAGSGAAYYDARRYLGELIDLATTVLTPMTAFDMSADARGTQLSAAYDPERSALIVKDGRIRGVVGEFRAEVRRAFKLPACAAGFEVHTGVLAPETPGYRPLSKFPSVTQDVSIRATGATYGDVAAVVNHVVSSQPTTLHITVTPTTIYRPESGQETTTTLRLNVTSYDATLTSGDVRPIVEAIDKAAKQAFDGHVV